MAPVTPSPTRPDLRLVEQTQYQCGYKQQSWEPLPSIDFMVEGMEGIRLTDATNLRFCHLYGRDDLMFQRTAGNSISCRIEVRGHSKSTWLPLLLNHFV